ncbi:Carboxypeptidase [Mycena indigotica]|uniref:Carboxypeptidase n=1 Tax=Mycena indigotica TaxID=2126181 RepID=A0A8H6W7D6_9AGAR|nr:Carboxypeptidase [Mycena indigotica]KAF7307577.1 Carboxypeptidase [Mycena indigotica]
MVKSFSEKFTMAIYLATHAFIATSLASQTVLPPLEDSYGFTPTGSLNMLTEATFTTLHHPAFPSHRVRVKKSDFCDGGVASYTGYIDIEARHLFFYFFESRNNPDTDDMIFWTNGGPACSSSMGLFMELGPCRVYNAENGTVYHPESWNSNANIFFVDQPIGAGFSYADYGESVSTTEEAAKDVAAFIAIFFAHFSKFQGRGLHLAGESYAGRLLPVFAAAIYDQNQYIVQAGIAPINLTSLMIGNGMTEAPPIVKGWYEMQCSSASIPPVQTIQTCVTMKRKLPRCMRWLKESCQDVFDSINCSAAMGFCMDAFIAPYVALGRNQYDISQTCADSNGLCYSITDEIVKYLNRPDIQKALGVDPSQSHFDSCAWDVIAAFGGLQGDVMHGSTAYISNLLERGIRVLVYAGNYDFACNWIGNEYSTTTLEWIGQKEFVAQPLREWLVAGKRAGLMRAAGPLTFATIDGAGHMAPYDKPKESLEMVRRWLAGQEL